LKTNRRKLKKLQEKVVKQGMVRKLKLIVGQKKINSAMKLLLEVFHTLLMIKKFGNISNNMEKSLL